MKVSTKRVFSILIAIFMFIASLFIYSSLIKSIYAEIKNKRTEIVSRLELINKYETSIKQIQKILSEYQNISQFAETISSILPPEQNVSQSVNQISGLAKINNLIINFLSVQQLAITPSSKPDLIRGRGVLRLNFALTGSYENFRKFVQTMETNISLMDLVSLKIEPKTETGLKSVKDNFSYAMAVDTYYQSK